MGENLFGNMDESNPPLGCDQGTHEEEIDLMVNQINSPAMELLS